MAQTMKRGVREVVNCIQIGYNRRRRCSKYTALSLGDDGGGHVRVRQA